MSSIAPYRFLPHERPILPGSPANPDHPTSRRVAYFTVGVIVALTGGLGNALITVNLGIIQGALGLYNDEGAWLPAAYAMTTVCANLLLVKYRQQFGMESFMRWLLVGYALLTLAHLSVHTFASAMLVRAISGIAGTGLTTLAILYMFQAMPAPKRLLAIVLGISLPQLSIPLARLLSPSLLEWDDWRVAYVFELGMALLALASMMLVRLPPSELSPAFEKEDFLSIAVFFPGIALLCAVLAEGRIVWWFDAPWLGWASLGALVLIAAALLIEHHRCNPLLNTRWLARREIVRIALVATAVRILLSEQTVGAVGLFNTAGLNNDQFLGFAAVTCLASVLGLVTVVLTFNPADMGKPIRIAALLIAAGAFLDAGSNNLIRPADLYFSQGLIAFASLLFIGPALAIGIARVLLADPRHFISFTVLFSITQNLGGLLGNALLGTFQIVREKYHAHEIVQQILLSDPQAVTRIGAHAGALNGVILDPVLRDAQALALLARQVTREANVLAYNDVFMLIGVLASLTFLWGIQIQFGMWRRGETSPAILLLRRLQQARNAS